MVLLCLCIFVLEENVICSVNVVDFLEMFVNCNIYGVVNIKFKRMFIFVYESYRFK